MVFTSKKVAKWQANYAQTIAHLMWETKLHLYVIDLLLLLANSLSLGLHQISHFLVERKNKS